MKKIEPLAFSMWDFSWLERRWTGAGYEDWDTALDQLMENLLSHPIIYFPALALPNQIFNQDNTLTSALLFAPK
jgi:hypothetical protein